MWRRLIDRVLEAGAGGGRVSVTALGCEGMLARGAAGAGRDGRGVAGRAGAGGGGRGGVRFYVVELGGSGSYAREEIQTVTVTLGAPVDHNGDPVKIYRRSAQKP